MVISVNKWLILPIIFLSSILYSACDQQSSSPLEKSGDDGAGRQPSQAVGTEVPGTDKQPVASLGNSKTVGSPEQGANSPVIDKLEVVLRSNQDVNVIVIDPHSSDPQPKIEIKTLYTAEITCKARSTKGDSLTYEWQSTGGKIYGEGKKITWLAPGAAIVYKITVTVSDSGGSSSAPVYISARCCY